MDLDQARAPSATWSWRSMASLTSHQEISSGRKSSQARPAAKPLPKSWRRENLFPWYFFCCCLKLRNFKNNAINFSSNLLINFKLEKSVWEMDINFKKLQEVILGFSKKCMRLFSKVNSKTLKIIKTVQIFKTVKYMKTEIISSLSYSTCWLRPCLASWRAPRDSSSTDILARSHRW